MTPGKRGERGGYEPPEEERSPPEQVDLESPGVESDVQSVLVAGRFLIFL